MGGSQGQRRHHRDSTWGPCHSQPGCRNRVHVHEGVSVQLCPHQMLKGGPVLILKMLRAQLGLTRGLLPSGWTSPPPLPQDPASPRFHGNTEHIRDSCKLSTEEHPWGSDRVRQGCPDPASQQTVPEAFTGGGSDSCPHCRCWQGAHPPAEGAEPGTFSTGSQIPGVLCFQETARGRGKRRMVAQEGPPSSGIPRESLACQCLSLPVCTVGRVTLHVPLL